MNWISYNRTRNSRRLGLHFLADHERSKMGYINHGTQGKKILPVYVLVHHNRAETPEKVDRIPSINSPFGKPQRLFTPDSSPFSRRLTRPVLNAIICGAGFLISLLFCFDSGLFW